MITVFEASLRGPLCPDEVSKLRALRNLDARKLASIVPAWAKPAAIPKRAEFVPDAPPAFAFKVTPGMRMLARGAGQYPRCSDDVRAYIARFESLNQHVPVQYELVNGTRTDEAIAA